MRRERYLGRAPGSTRCSWSPRYSGTKVYLAPGQYRKFQSALLTQCSHSIAEILDLLKSKDQVFKDVRQRTHTLGRSQDHTRGIPEHDWDTVDTVQHLQ